MNFKPRDFTHQENLIATCLSEMGIRFEQQKEFGQFTVDFWVADLRFVIEADGVYGHLKKRDRHRDAYLLRESDIENIFHTNAKNKAEIQEELWRALSRLSDDEKT